MENVMDGDNERGRPESRDGSRKKNQEKSHRGMPSSSSSSTAQWLMGRAENVVHLNSPAFTQAAQLYLHRRDIPAPVDVSKNENKSIWMNTKELEDEKRRNGVRKKEEGERGEKRKMESAEKEEEEEEKSDECEVTDDEEEEMPTHNHSRKTEGAPKEKKKRKDVHKKTSGKERSKARRASSTPAPSWIDSFRKDIISKFKYNKIPVPECRRVEIEEVDIENPEDLEEFSTENMMKKKIALQHHQLEEDEKRQFAMTARDQRGPRVQRAASRDQREESQESGRSPSTPSNRDASEEGEAVPTPSPPPPGPPRGRGGGAPSRTPVPRFDYESIRPVTDYERLSIEPPYEKRKFSR